MAEQVSLVAVHAGAGFHPPSTHQSIRRALAKSCRSAFSETENDTISGCSAAIESLEDNPVTNSGFGSNICMNETVECDAGLMDGDSLRSGALGAVKRIRNPIHGAEQILRAQLQKFPSNWLVPPNLLAGEGAEQFYASKGYKLCENYDLVSKQSLSQFRIGLRRISKSIPKKPRLDSYDENDFLSDPMNERLDTVGAIALSRSGDIVAGCSSGGILLKHPGRIGQGCLSGCGFWAEKTNRFSVGVSLSGCGEYIQQTALAREMSSAIIRNHDDCDPEVPVKFVSDWFVKNFTNSRLLRNYPPNHKVAGGIIVTFDMESSVAEVTWLHNTRNLALGYKVQGPGEIPGKEKHFISSLPADILPADCPVVNAFSMKIK